MSVLADTPLETIDIGGGFPVNYPHSISIHLDSYTSVIGQACEILS